MSRLNRPFPPTFHLFFLLTLGTLVWAYWPALVSLVEAWQSDPDYNHGFLVIPISLWLLWHRRDRITVTELHPSWWGIGLIAVSGLIRWFGAEFFIVQFEVWSIPLWIAGVVLLFGGWKLLKWSAGPIGFLWFMMPLPSSMTNFVSLPLQKISAVISTWTLHLFAQPAVRSGTTISLGEQFMDVQRACSGLRIVYGILALAVAYVVLMRPQRLRAVVLLASAVPVAVLANSARVTATGLLFLVVSGEKAHQYAHDFAGMLMLPMAVGLLWLVHMTMEKFVGAFERSPRSGSLLVLKSGLAILLVATGLVLWQQKQADAAVGTLLKIAERHETDGQRFQTDNRIKEAVQAWREATIFLDRYCRERPDDADAAKRLAVAAERLAFSSPGLVRAARYYERAWSLQPDDEELGFKHTRLALAGEDFSTAVSGAEKLLEQAEADSPQHLAAFQLKVQAQIQDADRTNAKTTWTQVTETLKQGINADLDKVTCSYLLAVVYRQYPLDSIPEKQRGVAAEKVFTDLLSTRPDDPLAWFSRSTFHRIFPASAPDPAPEAMPSTDQEPVADPALESDSTSAAAAAVAVPVQSPDEDLGRAIELASGNITPETHPIWVAGGSRALAAKEYENGRKYFRNAIQANPEHYLAYLQLALIETDFSIQGNRRDDVDPAQRTAAIEILKQGLSQEKLKSELLLRIELIRQQLQSNEAVQVAEANQEVLELKSQFQRMPPEVGVPLQLRLAIVESQVYADASDFVKASRLLESVLTSKEVAGMNLEAGLLSSGWLALGTYYEEQGLSDKASTCFQKGTTSQPDGILTKWHQALTADRANDISAAADLYEDVAVRLGNRAEPWLALARNELRQQLAKAPPQQDFTRFVSALNKAKTLNAPLNETVLIEAEFEISRGDNAKALALLDAAANQNPKSADLWRSLAILRQATGDTSGAQTALTLYQDTVENPLEATLLKTDLLVRLQDWDSARQVLTEALQTASSPKDQGQLHGQLVQIELLNNNADEAQKLLEQFAKQHADDIPAQMQLAYFYWERQKLDLLEQMERTLNKLEGDSGVFWKDLRARRLLQMAAQTKDDGERRTFVAEAKKILEMLPPVVLSLPQSQVLSGRLALQERRSADAARHFETAWIRGDRTPLLATELIYALQASGDAAKVEFLLEQMQNLLPFAPQLFDLALATNSKVSFADLDTSTAIAQGWVQSVADANSYVRLARTLHLSDDQREPQRTQRLDQIEVAYKKAIELDPKNPQSWGEFLRFIYRDRNDSFRMVSELNAFQQQAAIPELDRSFVTSQILTEFDFPLAAARSWNLTTELAAKSGNLQTQNRVLILAAEFFAGRDTPRAIELARQAHALNLNETVGLRLLTLLLSESDTYPESSLREASSLIQAMQQISEQSGRGEATDADNRIIASVLYRRAALLPTEYNKTVDLQEAARLLRSLKESTESDAVRLARIVGEQGDKQGALIALNEQARRTGASARTIRAFVEYWQDHFFATESLRDRVQQALQTLETTPGNEIVSLDLRLRPVGLTATEIDDLVDQFVTNVVIPASEKQAQDALLQQTFALLAKKNLTHVSLRLVSSDLTPLTDVQKLTALLIVSIQAPGSPEFEASLNGLVNSQLSGQNKAELDRAAADFYFMRANLGKAEEFYQRLLKRDATDIAALNNLALVVAELRSDFAESERLIQQGLAIMASNKSPAGSNSFMLDTQSQMLLAAGKTEQALEILTPLSQSVTADASVFLHLAECFHKMGRLEESQQAFSTARQLGISTSLLPPMDKRIYDTLSATHTEQAGL
ncbi:MAG: exosortase [Planctomycetales bacterium]|nr:exosortase [Planctomycetales bacterium]